jgi:hypothetical protein
MDIIYCKYWFQKRPIQIWDEQKALKVHQRGKPYTVLIGNESHPQCFLQVNLEFNFVGVNFLDNNLRNYLVYLFGEVEPGKLFLKEVISREYKDATDEVVNAKTLRFQVDGTTTVQESDLIQQSQFTKDIHSEVSQLWEPVPEFGHYLSIARLERWD